MCQSSSLARIRGWCEVHGARKTGIPQHGATRDVQTSTFTWTNDALVGAIWYPIVTQWPLAARTWTENIVFMYLRYSVFMCSVCTASNDIATTYYMFKLCIIAAYYIIMLGSGCTPICYTATRVTSSVSNVTRAPWTDIARHLAAWLC